MHPKEHQVGFMRASPGRLLLRAYCCMEPFIKGTDQTTCGTDVVAERSTGAASRLPRVGVPD